MNQGLKRFFNTIGFFLGWALNIAGLVYLVYFVYDMASTSIQSGRTYAMEMFEEKPYMEVTLTIEEGATLAEVSDILKKNGLISNAEVYRLEHMLKGNNTPYRGGTFTLNSQMDSSELNSKMRQVIVKSVDKKISIPEGRSILEIGRYLEEQGITTAEEFVETCNTMDFRYGFLNDVPMRENRLEGYLFPDTYFVSEDADATEVIDKMLSNFEEKFNSEYLIKAEEAGLTMDDVVIIASIIEKEINRSEERAKAASVIYNRLRKNMKLEMCSSVLYVLGVRKDRLLLTDLEVESPYNTYLHAGLPVGPITNPGMACIEAALNPVESSYLYFVVKDEDTGEHEFTDDYDEFLRAKERYNQIF